jgi:hypothetical protein
VSQPDGTKITWELLETRRAATCGPAGFNGLLDGSLSLSRRAFLSICVRDIATEPETSG